MGQDVPILFDMEAERKSYMCVTHQLTPDQAAANTLEYHGWQKYCAINLVYEGSGVYSDYKGKEYPIKPGTLFFRFPGYRHKTTLDQQPYSESWLVFSSEVFVGIQALGLIDVQRPVVYLDDIATAASTFKLLASVLPGSQPYAGETWHDVVHLVVELLTFAYRNNSSSQDMDSAVPAWLVEIKQKLQSQLGEPLTLQDLADSVELSPESVRKQFKDWMGVSPIAYRNDKRIEYACKALITKGVEQVADELGFADGKHFTRQFKARIGVAPREYQRDARQWMGDPSIR